MTAADLLALLDDVRGDAPAARERDLRHATLDAGHGLGWYIEYGKTAIARGAMISGNGWVAPADDAERLRAAIEHVAERDDDSIDEFVGAANNRIQQLQGRGADE